MVLLLEEKRYVILKEFALPIGWMPGYSRCAVLMTADGHITARSSSASSGRGGERKQKYILGSQVSVSYDPITEERS